ncbi:hypothetical protein [Kitasatospora sp. KL5]|uniref:hypothetical protein n=1 Tax=Kitasatospora sp. KL5 TaxID=3425125 RepID=UPI003D6E9C6D
MSASGESGGTGPEPQRPARHRMVLAGVLVAFQAWALAAAADAWAEGATTAVRWWTGLSALAFLAVLALRPAPAEAGRCGRSGIG